MSKISLKEIKELRAKTGVGVADCKEALETGKGDFDRAIDTLRKKGILKAKKRTSREASNGFIGSYVHNGQIGALVELVCETDFVARNEKFRKIAHDIALHIAASAPLYVSQEEVPDNILAKEKEIIEDKVKREGKPDNIIDKIVEGQMGKYYEEVCLLDQPYVRDEKKKIKDLIDESVASFGEKIEIRRFIRIVLGEDM